MKEFEKKPSPSREGLSKFLPTSMSDASMRRRLTEYEIQLQDLQSYVRSLEAETVHLRKKIEEAPKEFMIIENKLREANRQLVQAFNQNEKLVNALYEAREQITSLKEEVDKLCAPPSTYGVYLSLNEDGTVNILSQGRKVKVNLHPALKAEGLKPGQELILNEGLNVVEAAGYEIQGDVVILKEQLDLERAVVTLRADDLVAGSPYWADVIRVSKAASVARIKRALTIMGRKEEDAELDASMLIYPAMQVTDIHVLDLDLALGGMDQRHAHMLYRDLAPKLGWKQVIAVHTPLLVGLKGKGRMDAIEAKMSKSRPETAILIHDTPEEIARKVEKSFCPPKDTEDNFVTEVARLILLPRGPLRVARPEKFGGDVTFETFEDLAKAYRVGDLHPKDLKAAVASALADRLAPVRRYFAAKPEHLEALRKILAA